MITAAFAILWLVSSSAWGKALTDIKSATSPDYLVTLCHETCTAGEFPSMGRLNASVVSTVTTAPPTAPSHVLQPGFDLTKRSFDLRWFPLMSLCRFLAS